MPRLPAPPQHPPRPPPSARSRARAPRRFALTPGAVAAGLVSALVPLAAVHLIGRLDLDAVREAPPPPTSPLRFGHCVLKYYVHGQLR